MPSNRPARTPNARLLRRGAGVALVAAALALGAAACDDGGSASADTTTPPTTAAHPGSHGTGHEHPTDDVRYVSLGDSYTAAPLTAPDAEGSVPGCVQSSADYPHQVAARLDVADHTDASCTGAVTDDLLAPQVFDDGTEAPAQLDALDEDTTLVTLGIGGNDIGFADVIVECLRPSADADPCRPGIDHGPDGMSARIAATAPKVAEVLAEVAERSPHADVYVVGYPTIFPEHGSCFETVPFTETDVTYLHDVESELNAMLAQAAYDAGATFVDTEWSSAQHHACADPGQAWIEGLTPRTDAMPFHPNQLGATHGADQVVAAVAED